MEKVDSKQTDDQGLMCLPIAMYFLYGYHSSPKNEYFPSTDIHKYG